MTLDLSLLRPLLEEADDTGLRRALADYDRAVEHHHTIAQRLATTGGREEAERAMEAERLAAMLEGRQPTLGLASVTIAEAERKEVEVDLATVSKVVDARFRALEAAVPAASMRLWGVIARHRPEMLDDKGHLTENLVPTAESEPAVEPPPRRFGRRSSKFMFSFDRAARTNSLPYSRLWGMLRLPWPAWCPGHVRRGKVQLWWPPTLAGWSNTSTHFEGQSFHEWNEYVWDQLARNRWQLLDNGRVQFLDRWQPTNFPDAEYDRKRMAAEDARGLNAGLTPERFHARYEDGDVVMFGVDQDGTPGFDTSQLRDVDMLDPEDWTMVGRPLMSGQ
jgi:hypothetical protein